MSGVIELFSFTKKIKELLFSCWFWGPFTSNTFHKRRHLISNSEYYNTLKFRQILSDGLEKDTPCSQEDLKPGHLYSQYTASGNITYVRVLCCVLFVFDI